MEVKIVATNFKVSERLEEYINKKAQKLFKLEESILSVDVILKVVKFESAENKEAEIKVNVPGANVFASKVCDTFEEAVERSLEAVEKQLKKYKDAR